MEKQQKLDNYYREDSPWKSGLLQLRSLLLNTPLQEDWKWNFPTYTLDGKNVIGIASYKTHFGVWFFQGVFLKDEQKLLRNAQEGKTKAMRSFYFTSIAQLDMDVLQAYIAEAIQNARAGKVVKPQRVQKQLVIPTELDNAFKKAEALQTAFYGLTPGKQLEYAVYIASAKQATTRLRRLEKCIPMILNKQGIHDQYK